MESTVVNAHNSVKTPVKPPILRVVTNFTVGNRAELMMDSQAVLLAQVFP